LGSALTRPLSFHCASIRWAKYSSELEIT
jgi:hypothetical protein